MALRRPTITKKCTKMATLRRMGSIPLALRMGERAEAFALLAAWEQYGDPKTKQRTLYGIQMEGVEQFFKKPAGASQITLANAQKALRNSLQQQLDQADRKIARLPVWERRISPSEQYQTLQRERADIAERIFIAETRLNRFSPGWKDVMEMPNWDTVDQWAKGQQSLQQQQALQEQQRQQELQKSGQSVSNRPLLDPQKRYSASNQIKELMKQREGGVSHLKATGIGVFSRDGKLIGIYPHYVGDGGITLGYGHSIKASYLHDPAYEALLRKYVPNKNTPMNGKKNTIVPGSKYMDITDALALFEEDIRRNEDALDRHLKDAGIPITSNEFDALMLVRFNDGSVPKAFNLLKARIKDRSAWEEIWPTHKERLELALRIFFDNDYDMRK